MTSFKTLLNDVAHGNCIDIMQALPRDCIDLVLTDPPYIVNYRDRSGRSLANDNNEDWLKPAFAQMHRILRPGSFAISFYGWNKVDAFMTAWRAAGFQIVGHIVFRKSYASNARFLAYEHESAYLLAKGKPALPSKPLPDVLDFPYSGNRLHPTQKPVQPLKQLIDSFSKPGEIVLDPFCGSGSTLVAARDMGRPFIGIDLDPVHYRSARDRIRMPEPAGAAA